MLRDLLQIAHLFINLTELSDLPCLEGQDHFPVGPVPNFKPALASLSIYRDYTENLDGPSVAPPLATWFDLTAVKSFKCQWDEFMKDVSLHGMLDLFPATVKRLDFGGMYEHSVPALLSGLLERPHLSVTDFTLCSTHDDWVDAPLHKALNPLCLFPNLRKLHFQYAHPLSILDVGHAHLETLCIGAGEHQHEEPLSDVSYNSDGEPTFEDELAHISNITFTLGNPTYDLGLAICRLLKKSPGRFPRLARIGLLPGCLGTASGHSGCQQLLFRDVWTRSDPGIRRLARMYDKIGLVLLDENQVEWRPEWFDEKKAK